MVPTDILLLGTIFLLLSTIIVVVLYYRLLKKTGKEYLEARNVVGDVIISFNKQVQRVEDQLNVVSYKTETVSAKSATMSKKLEGQESILTELASKVSGISDLEAKVEKQNDDMQGRFGDLIRVQKELEQRIAEAPEAKIETVIPIKRERALAPLTETELRVVEFMADGGEKSAPEIKNFIKLTREHTSRLVKKLYEEGYLERDMKKTPYMYHVKEEMLEILKKTEAKT
jgi:DNA-binding CsgD family transcriptional regulator